MYHVVTCCFGLVVDVGQRRQAARRPADAASIRLRTGDAIRGYKAIR
jgi:hypothetical protein